MNRRTYLRTLGAAVGTATLASAGATAAEGDGVPEAVRQAPVGASDTKVPDVPDDAIDVRDYGAQIDGSTDDSGAIQDAVDAAARSGTPDTVFVPEGTVRMSETIRFYGQHSGVTLQGAGSATHLRLDEGFDSNHRLVYVNGSNEGGVQDVTVRDLRLDGQGAGQNNWHGWGIVTFDDEENSNLLFENLWIHDWAGTNLQIGGRDTIIRHVSSWGAKEKQGIATDNGTSSRPVTIERSHFYDNSVHGINASQGHTRVKQVLSEENGWGAKNTPQTSSCEWQQVVFRNNDEHGYLLSSSPQTEISFDNTIAEGNGRSGFRLVDNADVQIGTIAARANNQAGRGGGNVHIGTSITLDADTVYSFDSPMAGLLFDDYGEDPSVNIETYIYGNNDEALNRNGPQLSLGESRDGQFPDIDPLGGDSLT